MASSSWIRANLSLLLETFELGGWGFADYAGSFSTINGNIPVDYSVPPMIFGLQVLVDDVVWDLVTLSAYQAYIYANIFSHAGVSGVTLYHEPADALASRKTHSLPDSVPGVGTTAPWNPKLSE
jgi:hypothetical protein